MLQLDKMLTTAQNEISAAKDMKKIEELKVQYLGKKGELTQILRSMSTLDPKDRPAAGKAANEAREKLNELFENAEKIIAGTFMKQRLDKERLDVTMPGKRIQIGHTHPLTQVIRKIEDIFIGLGYQIAEGPEIESVHYNFDQLNTPENHPSKDEQDTFYSSLHKVFKRRY